MFMQIFSSYGVVVFQYHDKNIYNTNLKQDVLWIKISSVLAGPNGQAEYYIKKYVNFCRSPLHDLESKRKKGVDPNAFFKGTPPKAWLLSTWIYFLNIPSFPNSATDWRRNVKGIKRQTLKYFKQKEYLVTWQGTISSEY